MNSISVQTSEMELGSSNLAGVSGLTQPSLPEGEESSPSEDSMVSEEDEGTSKYYMSLLKEQEERFNMYKEELIFKIEHHKQDMQAIEIANAQKLQELKNQHAAELKALNSGLEKKEEKHKEYTEVQRWNNLKAQMHYEDMLSRAENESYNLKKHHKEEIDALKADKNNGLGMVIAKFTEREVQKDKVIDNLHIQLKKQMRKKDCESVATNTVVKDTKCSSTSTTKAFITKLAAKSIQTVTNNDVATRNKIQDLKNSHEKELQIVVGKTKAVLRSNFRKQILEFEKEYDARIAQMKTNLRDELNKKHDDELRRLKDRHLKDIKMMKLEIKKKRRQRKREAIRFFIVEKQHQKKS